MECEVCGRQIYGGERSVIIDGARLVVCPDCARSATPAPPTSNVKATVKATKKPAGAPKVRQRRTVVDENAQLVSENVEVVKNFGTIVRGAREKMGLSHDDLSRKSGVKVSVLHNVETERMVPDRDTARKLEHTLKIKLLQPVLKVPVGDEFKKPPADLTLGDMVFVQDEKK